MMMANYLRMTMMSTVFLLGITLAAGDSLMGGHLDNKKSSADTGNSLHYRILNGPYAFNGGQPFSLEKDPVTGKIDFNKAPPLTAYNYTGSYDINNNEDEDDDGDNNNNNNDSNDDDDSQMENEESENGHEEANNDTHSAATSLDDEDQQIPNEINPYSPSFHDFLNLPVRYSDHEKYHSDKYPLISNSYANTKVQGGGGNSAYNAYIINNHKNYHAGGEASTSQSYSMTRKPYVPRITTRRPNMTVRTTPATSTTMKPKPTMRTTTTTTTTTPRPTTTTTTTTPSTTTKKPTTEPVTTWKPSKVPPKIDRYDIDYGDALLPIEKIQNSAPGNRDEMLIHDDNDNDYEDHYEEYVMVEPNPRTSTTSSTTTTTTTTTMMTTTTSTTEVPTTQTTPQPTPQPDPVRTFENVEPKRPVPVNNPGEERYGETHVEMNRPQMINLNGGGDNEYAGHGMSHPSYSGLVVESASNVIVPPDQDTISFVLGNKQHVQGTYYAHGSAIPESPYGDVGSVRPLETGHTVDLSIGRPAIAAPIATDGHQYPNQMTQDRYTPNDNSQKWWYNNDHAEKSQSVTEKVKDDNINVVAGYRVVFPTSAPEISSEVPIAETLGLSTTVMPSQEVGQLSEILTPPAIDTSRPLILGQRPDYHHPPYHHYHRRPPPEVPATHLRLPLAPNENSYKIRQKPNSLPNILPQFRPGSQRRGSEVIGTMLVSNPGKYPQRVTIRGGPPPQQQPLPPSHHRGPQRPRPLPPSPHLQPQSHLPPQPHLPPQSHPPHSHLPPGHISPPSAYLQRLNPPPPPPVHALRLPTPAALIGNPEIHSPVTESIPLSKDSPHRRNGINNIEGKLDERNRLAFANGQILKSRLNDEDMEKLSAEAPAMPPRAPLFPKRKNGNSSVATLQMIQHLGAQSSESVEDNDGNDNDNDSDNDNDTANRRGDEAPVYVVYPVKGSIDINDDTDNTADKRPMDESVVIGTHGPQRPLPPENLTHDEDNDEIVSSVQSLPPLPVRLASDFPYALEKPDPSLFINQVHETPLLVPTEQHEQQTEDGPFDDKSTSNQDRDTSINIIPYLQDHQPFAMKPNAISATLQLLSGSSPSSSTSSPTASPIAYVYTPTMRAPVHRQNESYERNPVLLPSQQPSSSSSSAPSPQNFMAPFVASLSAETPSKNGWSVVTGDSFVHKPESNDRIDTNYEDKNHEDKDDTDAEDKKDTDERNTNTSTKSSTGEDDKKNNEETEADGNKNIFDSDNFKPQLFSGFQPIFEFSSDSEEMPGGMTHPDPAMMEKPRGTEFHH